jgi:NAD(P)-dependent dehydrogenase (short-subunit alcohol dehydrogenase family)
LHPAVLFLSPQHISWRPPADEAFYTGGINPALREQRRKASVLGREGTSWDIGHALRFLLSNHARYITGQTLIVDGGATLVGPLAIAQLTLRANGVRPNDGDDNACGAA